jgi:hypothetical protein
MITSTIIALAGVMGLLWMKKVRNNFTKLVNAMLGLSAISILISYLGISSYSPYAIAFFSLLASFEATSSFSMNRQQVIFMIVSGITFFVLSITMLFPAPFEIPYWAFSILFLLAFVFHWKTKKKNIYSRVGILIVWSGISIAWLVSPLLSMF